MHYELNRKTLKILANEPTRMAKERGRSQNAVHVAVVGIAPENTKQ